MDIRHALRGFSRHTGFAALAIALLALFVALNTAIFGLVDGVLLKPLPVKNPDELVTINGEQRDFSYLIFDQLRWRIADISSLPFVINEVTNRIETAHAESRTPTQPIRVPPVLNEFRVHRAEASTSRAGTLEDDQVDEVKIAGLNNECPLSRDKAVISKRVEQKLLVIVSLTAGELPGEPVESGDEVQTRAVRNADCLIDGAPGACPPSHEDRSNIHSPQRNQICPSLVGRKVAADDEDQLPDDGPTPAPPPERAQERRR